MIESLIRVASSFVGVVEEPRGSNRGIVIDFANLYAIQDEQWAIGAPWCASFVTLCGTLALGQLGWPVPRTARVQTIYDWGVTRNAIVYGAPEPGDLLCLYYARLKRYGHIGIVERVDAQRVHTIEGNTSTGGSREGYGVMRHARALDADFAFVRWVHAL